MTIQATENTKVSHLHQPAAKPPAPIQGRSRHLLFTRLKAEIKRLEQVPVGLEHQSAIHTETVPQQKDLPRMAAGWCHEIWAEKPDHTAAATALLLTCLSGEDQPILWVTNTRITREHGLPFAPGFMAHGFDPARLIIVQATAPRDALWAIEEGLKSRIVAAVVGEIDNIELDQSRRLSLAAKETGIQCLLLLRSPHIPPSTAYTRWRTAPATSTGAVFDEGVTGPARLEVTLVKHRAGTPPHTKLMEWQNATNRFDLVASVADRALETRTPGTRTARR